MRPEFSHKWKAIAFSAAALALGVPLGVAAAELGMLDRLTPGMWEVRERGGGAVQKICVRNGRELIQLRHRNSACSRLVVADEASKVTVEYSCKGQGYGRTDIRREGATLVQLDSRGIANGLPFEIVAEARRTGGC